MPLILLVIYLIYFCILGINPYSRPVWFVENMTIVPIVLFLVFTYRKFQFSNISYVLMSFLILCTLWEDILLLNGCRLLL